MGSPQIIDLHTGHLDKLLADRGHPGHSASLETWKGNQS